MTRSHSMHIHTHTKNSCQSSLSLGPRGIGRTTSHSIQQRQMEIHFFKIQVGITEDPNPMAATFAGCTSKHKMLECLKWTLLPHRLHIPKLILVELQKKPNFTLRAAAFPPSQPSGPPNSAFSTQTGSSCPGLPTGPFPALPGDVRD